MPMKGLLKSSSFSPAARSRLRCPARSMPFLTVSDRMASTPGLIVAGIPRREEGGRRCRSHSIWSEVPGDRYSLYRAGCPVQRRTPCPPRHTTPQILQAVLDKMAAGHGFTRTGPVSPLRFHGPHRPDLLPRGSGPCLMEPGWRLCPLRRGQSLHRPDQPQRRGLGTPGGGPDLGRGPAPGQGVATQSTRMRS